ncbi:MAG TPA: hypothetical protein VFJ43_14490 [Bacteroidia bacterium]|nr:hypothetical protein [Bacteroidia bacterium]
MMKTQTKYPITSMSRLRKEKKRLLAQIEDEKKELFSEVEKYKNSLWPFRAMNKFRKTVDALSENKLLVLGAQLAQSALNTAKEKKEEKSSGDGKHKIIDFLKSMANNFLDMYTKHEKDQKE